MQIQSISGIQNVQSGGGVRALLSALLVITISNIMMKMVVWEAENISLDILECVFCSLTEMCNFGARINLAHWPNRTLTSKQCTDGYNEGDAKQECYEHIKKK